MAALKDQLVPELVKAGLLNVDDFKTKAGIDPWHPIMEVADFNSLIALSQEHQIPVYALTPEIVGKGAICPGYSRLQISSDSLMRIHANGPGLTSDTTFDLEIRTRLARVTYQFPDDIAEGIRMVSPIELWNEIARYHGAEPAAVKTEAGVLRGELTQIVNRRNKIVHEGDLQPNIPRIPWPIARQDADHVKATIEKIVDGIEAKV